MNRKRVVFNKIRICETCGSEYMAHSCAQKYCSLECGHEAIKRRREKWNQENPHYYRDYFREKRAKDFISQYGEEYNLEYKKRELKPCPLCGSDDVNVVWYPNFKDCYVACRKCDLRSTNFISSNSKKLDSIYNKFENSDIARIAAVRYWNNKGKLGEGVING